MSVYIILILSATLVMFFEKNSTYERFYAILIVLLSGLIAGLRYETGYDWLSYEMYFDDIDTNIIYLNSLFPGPYDQKFEFGYYLINWVFKLLLGDVSYVFFAAAVFHAVCLAVLLSKTERHHGIAVVMYLSFCYLMAQFIITRYSIAAGFVYLAISSVLEKNTVRSYFLVFLGALFHFFALIYFGIIFLRNYKPRFFFIVIISAVFGCLVFYGGGHFVLLIDFLSFILPEKYLVYKDYLINQVSPSSVIYFIFNLIIYYFISRHKINNKSELQIVNISLWLTTLLLFSIAVLYPVPSFWNRIMIIAIPIQGMAFSLIIKQSNFLNRFTFKLLLAMTALCLFFYPLAKEQNLFVPYESVIHSGLGFSTGVGRDRIESLYEEAHIKRLDADSEEFEGSQD